MNDRIRILATGGTFDKEYDEITGELFFKATHIGDMLKLGRCRLDLHIETLTMIDSLQMTDAHRELILRRCLEAPEKRIVITHGTDTITQTAAVLGPSLIGKTVVLTGAMVPIHLAAPTDCLILARRWPLCRPWSQAYTWR